MKDVLNGNQSSQDQPKCPFTSVSWNPKENSQEVNKQIREQCPVAHSDEFGGVWGIFKYEDILKATRDPETFANGYPRHAGRPRPPLESDPPEHTTIRKTMQPFFGKKQMQELEPSVQKLVRELLDPLLQRGHGEFINEVANPLPVRTIQAFLNFPDEDWRDIIRWSHDIFESSYGKTPERYEEAVESFQQYCVKMVKDRRTFPRDPHQDIMTRILDMEVNGSKIDDITATGILSLLLTAGHESTIVSMGIVLNYLAEHEDVQQQLRGNPKMIEASIEEILRHDSPVSRMPRAVAKDIEIQGQHLKAGDKVFLMWGSGNRDETAYENADQVDFERGAKRNLVFGYGIHKCIGAPIALLELRVLFEEILKNTSKIKLNGEVERTGYPHFGFKTLPIAFEK
jgi:cytochrome P450